MGREGAFSKEEAARDPWLKKLHAGDLDGPVLREAQYIRLRTSPVVGNPRHTEEYKDRCVDAVGLGDKIAQEKKCALVARGLGTVTMGNTPWVGVHVAAGNSQDDRERV